MTEAPKDYEEMELVTVKLPRKDYETLKKVLEREAAYDWFIFSLKSHWIWIISAGVLTLWMLYDNITGVVK